MQHPRVRLAVVLIAAIALGEIILWVALQPPKVLARLLDPAARSAVTQTAAPGVAADPRLTAASPPDLVVITPTPQPPDVFAAATQSVQLTATAQRQGTPTPLPVYVRIATLTPIPPVVTATPTAANAATAAYHAQVETAVAFTTGTPYVRLATPTPPAPTAAPRPENNRQQVTATPPPPPTATAAPTVAPTETATPMPTLTPTPTVRPASPTPAATATPHPLAVLTATPTDLPAWMRAAPVPTAVPTDTPAPAVEYAPVPEGLEAVRIRFESGATAATVTGYVAADQPVQFVLGARAAQPMRVLLQNENGELARVDVSAADGTNLGTVMTGQTWSSLLPATQDYYLTVRVPIGGTGHNFSLWVEILP